MPNGGSGNAGCLQCSEEPVMMPCRGGVEWYGRYVGWPLALLTSMPLLAVEDLWFSCPSCSARFQISPVLCAMRTDHVVLVISHLFRGLHSETCFSLKPGSSLCTARLQLCVSG